MSTVWWPQNYQGPTRILQKAEIIKDAIILDLKGEWGLCKNIYDDITLEK